MSAARRHVLLRRFAVSIAAVLLLLAVLGVLALLAVRNHRGSFDPPLEVAPGIYGVRSAGGIWQYGARAGAAVVLFDAGVDPEGRPLDALLRALRASRAQVTDVFVTHGHADHTAGLALLSGARIHLGAGDVDFAEGRRALGPLSVLTAVVLSVPRTKVTDPIGGPEEAVLADGEAVRVVPVPGHTPGSCAFVFREVLFAGDILSWKGNRIDTGPAFFDQSPRENLASVRALARAVREHPPALVCTGHGGCTPPGAVNGLLSFLSEP
ncbi:MAG TPA: MBL fold metallo-hydrolase [Anaeromyxobacteraceae bacterium]|nr:MBL fold metallo-hydrolase [Anaeromyxobacteraceae bacterium]